MISKANEGQDVLGELVKQSTDYRTGGGYDPYQWQRRENYEKGRTEWGATHPDADPPALQFPVVPENNMDAKGWLAAEELLYQLQPEIKPFKEEIAAKYGEVRAMAPVSMTNNQVAELAVCLIRNAHALPLHGEKPRQNIVGQLELEGQRDGIERGEVARLSEAYRKTLEETGGFDSSTVAAYREMGSGPNQNYKGDGQDPIGAVVGVPQPKPVPSGGKRK